jgi:hypothetical protein
MASQKFNLGTNIFADVSSLTFSSDAVLGEKAIVGGSGAGNRLQTDYTTISNMLHNDLKSKLITDNTDLHFATVLKIPNGHDGVISKCSYSDSANPFCLAISIGATLNEHTVSGKDEVTTTDFGTGSIVTYVESGEAQTEANYITSSEITPSASHTDYAVNISATQPISYTNTSGSDGYIVWLVIDHSSNSESVINTALADYVIS